MASADALHLQLKAIGALITLFTTIRITTIVLHIQADHGLAMSSDFDFALQAGARYAEGLLKALGIKQAVAVGHSAGALTAMELFKR